MSNPIHLPRFSRAPPVQATALSHLEERVCLLCGTAVPSSVDAPAEQAEGQLRALGWHCWHSRASLTPHELLDSSLRLCPSCLTDPTRVATTILQRHGLAHMEEWLRSMRSFT
jgi:hypothetical protein